MNTAEFEALLDGAEESDVLEFKGPMVWEQSIIKDILAMANVQDGGRIIIGIVDGTCERIGLTQAQISTFDFETIQDRVASFADPRVEFRVDLVSDRNGLNFIVIDVRPFETIPVVCRRDGADLREGDVYYRSRSGRPASARVRKSADMRDIIEVAITRSRRRLSSIGFVTKENSEYDYDSELGGL